MNEPANFCSGEICRVPADHDYSFEVAHLPTLNEDGTIEPTESCPLRCWTREELLKALEAPADCLLLGTASASHVNDSAHRIPAPRYQVANSNAALPLSTNTVGLSVTGWGADGPGALHFDTHSLYGFTEAAATHAALLEATKTRPFVLTRSSFPGTGRFAAHWTGDNAVTWNDLHWSVAGVINSGLYGMPMAGADICGFNGLPDPELCARWIGVGAWYPFSRNHHVIAAGQQVCLAYMVDACMLYTRTLAPLCTRSCTDGPAWQTQAARRCPCATPCCPTSTRPCTMPAAVAAPRFGPCGSTTRAMLPRSTSTGTRRSSAPPSLVHVLSLSACRQFMVGDALLVTPVLAADTDAVEGYLAAGHWHLLWEGPVEPSAMQQGPARVEFTAPLGEVPVHVAAGHVLPMQVCGRPCRIDTCAWCR